MVITFLSESGELLRDQWRAADLTDSAPMVGDRVIMNDAELMAVTSRTFGFVEDGSGYKFHTVHHTLRKVE
jgi:hypothetical protein